MERLFVQSVSVEVFMGEYALVWLWFSGQTVLIGQGRAAACSVNQSANVWLIRGKNLRRRVTCSAFNERRSLVGLLVTLQTFIISSLCLSSSCVFQWAEIECLQWFCHWFMSLSCRVSHRLSLWAVFSLLDGWKLWVFILAVSSK